MPRVVVLAGHDLHMVDPNVSVYLSAGQRSQSVPLKYVPGGHGTGRELGQIESLDQSYGLLHRCLTNTVGLAYEKM